jgi:small GTP-binding protein
MSKGRESKPHIGIYGRRNNGKSSLINSLAGQDIAIVSDQAGTTTDPVKKSFEITGFGPVIFVDTAGIDDFGDLGEKRVERTVRTLEIIDLALLLVTANSWGKYEDKLVTGFNEHDIPFIVIHSTGYLGLQGQHPSNFRRLTNGTMKSLLQLSGKLFLNTRSRLQPFWAT